MECYQERAIYYWRHGLYGHVEEICKIGLSNKNSNLFLMMYQGLAKGITEQTGESLELLSRLSERKDLYLLYKVSLYCAHCKSKNRDENIISQLKKEINKYSIQLNPLAAYYSAQVFWLFGYNEMCQSIISKSQQIQNSVDSSGKSYYPSHATYLLAGLQGWIYLTTHKSEKALKCFNAILEEKSNSYDISSLCGKALCLVKLGQYSESIQIYARILSKFDFPELQIEKCRIYILMQRWELITQISETKNSLFSSFEINMMIIFNKLLTSKNEKFIVSLLDELLADFLKYEKFNWFYQMIVSISIGTMCSKSLSIIDRLMKLASNAAEVSDSNPISLSALCYIQMLAGNHVAAISTLSTAIENGIVDDFNIELQIKLLIDTGRYSEASDMLDMYEIVSPHTMIYHTLRSKLNRKMNQSGIDEKTLFNELLNSFEKQMNNYTTMSIPYSDKIPLELSFEMYIESFIRFRIDTVIEALDELITYNNLLSFDVFGYSSLKNDSNRLIQILIRALKISPFFMPFNFFLALLYKKCGKIDDALLLFEKNLSSPSCYRLSQCLVNVADISYQKEQIDFAASCIEAASYEDPTLISSIDFIILKSKITSNVRESIKHIFKLFQKSPKNLSGNNENVSFVDTESQPFINYIKFIDFCISANEYKIASNLVKTAAKKAVFSSEKSLVILKRIQILAFYKEYEKAFIMIGKLKQHKKYLSKAIELEGDIYLNYMKDQSKFLSVFHSFSAISKSSESYVLLGRAFLKVKKFNEAIDAFKRSLDDKDPDKEVLKELIMTYISANRFDEAISCFISHVHVLRNSGIFAFDFIKLMIEIKRYQEAIDCISRIIQVHSNKNYLSYASLLELKGIVQSHILKAELLPGKKSVSIDSLSGVHTTISYSTSIENLKNSLSILENMLSEITETNPFILKMKLFMSNIVYEIGQNYLNLQEREKAIESFFKALEYYPKNAQAAITLFDLYKSRYDSERCRKVCLDYLEVDPQNETIALLLTSTQTENMHLSIPYLQNVLDVHPLYFRCLVRLVEICARSGKLKTAVNYIKKAKCNDPGFYFVQGLYFSYVNNIKKAMKFFKLAKTSNKWEIAAQIQIFNLLTNPERKYLWFEKEPFSSEENLNEAEEIFKSLLSIYDNNKNNNNFLSFSDIQMLKGDLLCAKNTEESIKEAIDVYSFLIKERPTFTGGSVGLARCLTKIGEFERATGLLKYVLTGKPFQETFSYFEETYLMLAYIVEKETNFNSAQHYIYLALELNMSCKKGWEMSAKVQLKRKMYSEAAASFRYCWELCDHNDPEVGYNYAYCCMKAKRYDTALIVSREVMNLYPDYKDLKETVIKPSFQNIKC